jgi:hypothetical protein
VVTAGDDGGVVGAIAEPASSESWTEADAARVLVAVGGPVLWWSLVATIVGLATWSTLERLTWYVANMQIGLLTFAHDLTQGSVFHHAPALDALRELLPSRTDALSQTYVWEDGRLHSRYAPGYPLLLAVGMAVAGPSAAHYVNVVIFAALLVLLVALGSRLLGSRWLGAAVPALVMLFPSRTRWWAQTPTMDLAAHGFALLGLYLVLGVRGRLPSLARAAGAGLALGYAVSIRPDAVLYLLPAMALAVFQWRRERWRRPAKLAAVALAGLLIGMGPFLGYNWLATGSPLRPTQGMELEAFWQTSTATDGSSPVPASPVRRVRLWRGTTVTQVQGGGLRFVNLPKVLPDQLGQVRRIYGDVLLGAAILGALLSLAVRPRLFLVTVPYVLVALPFFSCWSRRDQRLLIGVDLLLPLLVLQGTIGTLDLVRRLVNDGRTMRRRVVALLLAVAWVGVAWVGWRWMPERSVDVMLAAWTVPALTGTLLLGTIAALAFSCALSTHEARAMTARPLPQSTVPASAGGAGPTDVLGGSRAGRRRHHVRGPRTTGREHRMVGGRARGLSDGSGALAHQRGASERRLPRERPPTVSADRRPRARCQRADRRPVERLPGRSRGHDPVEPEDGVLRGVAAGELRRSAALSHHAEVRRLSTTAISRRVASGVRVRGGRLSRRRMRVAPTKTRAIFTNRRVTGSWTYGTPYRAQSACTFGCTRR